MILLILAFICGYLYIKNHPDMTPIKKYRIYNIAFSISIVISTILAVISSVGDFQSHVQYAEEDAEGLSTILNMFVAAGSPMISFFLAMINIFIGLVFLGIIWIVYAIFAYRERKKMHEKF